MKLLYQLRSIFIRQSLVKMAYIAKIIIISVVLLELACYSFRGIPSGVFLEFRNKLLICQFLTYVQQSEIVVCYYLVGHFIHFVVVCELLFLVLPYREEIRFRNIVIFCFQQIRSIVFYI